MVKPKKYLGQHFLTDEKIAQQIVGALSFSGYTNVLEIGPGMGVLTKLLIEKAGNNFSVVEIDAESVLFLKNMFPQLEGKIIEADFLKLAFDSPPFGGSWRGAVIGNFPYNISSQILFKVFENKTHVPEVVGMFQKEVAQRICSPPGNKSYGILSVLLQAFYDCEYLFTVDEHVFNPPPKVKSGVIRLRFNKNKGLKCNEAFFKKTVKAAFNQRRKTLRNALKSFVPSLEILNALPYLDKRAEQLSYLQFEEMVLVIENYQSLKAL